MLVRRLQRLMVATGPRGFATQVMAAACALAVLTYVLRVGFAVASPQIKNELQLSSTQLAYLMAAFLLAYGMFEAPGGWLADRIGVRHFLTLLVLGASTATGLLSAVGLLPANLTLQFGFLFLLRFCFGMLQAGVFPSCSRMLTDWMPVGRRASAQVSFGCRHVWEEQSRRYCSPGWGLGSVGRHRCG